MDKEVLDDLSLKTKDAFAIVLQGRWQDGGYVQQDLIQRDVNELMPAFRLGFTNEMLMYVALRVGGGVLASLHYATGHQADLPFCS